MRATVGFDSQRYVRSASALDLFVGQQVRRRRQQLDISQQELAAQLGISFQQLQKYERGANRISAGRLFEMSKILQVEIGWFFDGASPLAESVPAEVREGTDDEAAPPESPLRLVVHVLGADKLLAAYSNIATDKRRRKAIELVEMLASEED